MKRLDLGMVVRHDGKLAEVVSIGEGRHIGLRYVKEPECPTCGRVAGVEFLEHAPILQDSLEAVETLSQLKDDLGGRCCNLCGKPATCRTVAHGPLCDECVGDVPGSVA